MRKALLASATFVVLGLGAASAEAVSCNSWACVNKQLSIDAATIKKDAKVISQDHRAITVLDGCLAEEPLTQYGDESKGTFGYQYADGTHPVYATTALDITETGTKVGGWAMFDRCNTMTSTASAARDATLTREFGPIAAIGPLFDRSVNRP